MFPLIGFLLLSFDWKIFWLQFEQNFTSVCYFEDSQIYLIPQKLIEFQFWFFCTCCSQLMNSPVFHFNEWILTQKVGKKLFNFDFFAPTKAALNFSEKKIIHLKYSLFKLNYWNVRTPVINIVKYLFGLLHIMSQYIFMCLIITYLDINWSNVTDHF